MNEILKNELFTDNVNEALSAVIVNDEIEWSMLICEAIDKSGVKYQVHIRVTCYDHAFIKNTEGIPVFSVSEDCKLIEKK